MLNVNKKDYKVYESTIDVLNQENLSFCVNVNNYPESDFAGFENFVTSNYSYSVDKTTNPDYILFIHSQCNLQYIQNILKQQITQIDTSLNNILQGNLPQITNLINNLPTILEYNIYFNEFLKYLKNVKNDILIYLK